jgi:hypothetical protein
VGEGADVEASLAAIDGSDFGYEQARHLLFRAGFGGTPAQIQTLVAWGPEKSVSYLLDPEGLPDDLPKGDAFDRDIMRPLTEEERRMVAQARRSGDEDALAKVRIERQRREGRDRQQMVEIQKWWLQRLIETANPLQEKMVLFWHGHFATNYRTIENSYHMFLQNALFRTHAVGNFGALLGGIVRDPAMIAYLDNNDSRKGRANENLAREIMELFSLGIGRYGEQYIKLDFSVNPPQVDVEYGQPTYLAGADDPQAAHRPLHQCLAPARLATAHAPCSATLSALADSCAWLPQACSLAHASRGCSGMGRPGRRAANSLGRGSNIHHVLAK